MWLERLHFFNLDFISAQIIIKMNYNYGSSILTTMLCKFQASTNFLQNLASLLAY